MTVSKRRESHFHSRDGRPMERSHHTRTGPQSCSLLDTITAALSTTFFLSPSLPRIHIKPYFFHNAFSTDTEIKLSHLFSTLLLCLYNCIKHIYPLSSFPFPPRNPRFCQSPGLFPPASDIPIAHVLSVQACRAICSVPNSPVRPSSGEDGTATAHSPSFWGCQDGL